MSGSNENNMISIEKYRSLERKLMKKTEENNKLKTLIKDYQKNIEIIEKSLNSAKEQFIIVMKSLSNQKKCEFCMKNEDFHIKYQKLLDELVIVKEKLNRCQIEKNCVLENTIRTYIVNCIKKGKDDDQEIETENENENYTKTKESNKTVNSYQGNFSDLNDNSKSKPYQHEVGYVLCEPIPSLIKFMYSMRENETIKKKE